MKEGTEFQRVLPEVGPAAANPSGVTRVVFCSGKVYYDLVAERTKRGLDETVAIARVEQIAPFPYDLVKAELDRYPGASVLWAQEEHKNGGPWSYVAPRFATAMGGARHMRYAGRPVSPSTATGNKRTHTRELENLLADAMVGEAAE